MNEPSLLSKPLSLTVEMTPRPEVDSQTATVPFRSPLIRNSYQVSLSFIDMLKFNDNTPQISERFTHFRSVSPSILYSSNQLRFAFSLNISEYEESLTEQLYSETNASQYFAVPQIFRTLLRLSSFKESNYPSLRLCIRQTSLLIIQTVTGFHQE